MLRFHDFFIQNDFVKKISVQYLISFQGWTRPTIIPEMQNHFTYLSNNNCMRILKMSLTCSNFTKFFIWKKFVKKISVHYLISFQGWARPTKIPEMRNHDFSFSKKHTLLVSFTNKSDMLQFHELSIPKQLFVKKNICITLSASRAGHARQKFQKCEIMIFILARS